VRLGEQRIEIYAPDLETISEDMSIGHFKPASDEAVQAVLAYDPDLPDGDTRSEWLWVRLANGDLILGVFPQDEGYFAHEQEHSG
jgi:hypothetical protein